MKRWLISYPRLTTLSAKLSGKAIFVVGYHDGKPNHEFHRQIDWPMADSLFSLCLAVVNGYSPKEAFERVYWPEPVKESAPEVAPQTSEP